MKILYVVMCLMSAPDDCYTVEVRQPAAMPMIACERKALQSARNLFIQRHGEFVRATGCRSGDGA